MVGIRKSLIFLGLVVTSCTYLFREFDLTFKPEPFISSNLQTNGYYYSIEENPANSPRVFFLYRDGSLLWCGAFSSRSEPQMETILMDSAFLFKVRNRRSSWGLFKVEGDSISYEVRYPRGHDWVPYIHKGVITSDTTFEIREWVAFDGTEEEPHHVDYRFKKFYPKPDSTNEFLK